MPTTKYSTVPKKKRARKKLIGMAGPKRHNFDRYADQLAKGLTGSDDDLLTTPETAAAMRCSVQWLEIGRFKGYGPQFKRIGPGLIRYRRGDLRSYLAERTHQSTSEYAK